MQREELFLFRLRSGVSLAMKSGDIALDNAAQRVTRGVREVRVGPTEFRLLNYMMQNSGRVLSREDLRNAAWPLDQEISARTVDVYVGRLRRALNRGKEHDPIRTVRYAGYVFAVQNSTFRDGAPSVHMPET